MKKTKFDRVGEIFTITLIVMIVFTLVAFPILNNYLNLDQVVFEKILLGLGVAILVIFVTMVILLTCVIKEEPRKISPEIHTLNLLNKEQFLKNIKNNIIGNNYERFYSQVFEDGLSFDFYINGEGIIDGYYYAIADVYELTEHLVEKIFSLCREQLEEYHGGRLFTGRTFITVLICVEKPTQEYYDFLERGVIQDRKHERLWAGVCFEKSELLISKPIIGIRSLPYKSLRNFLLEILSNQ